jgi:tetratricopeptide (TPR) repeat protein
LGRARLLQEAGLRAKALDDLEQARKGLGTEDDLYLLLQIQKERTALTEPERAAARRSLELAQALVNAGKADKALERLKPLAALRPPEQITSDDFEKALALQTKAEFLKSAPAKPGFLAEIGKTLWAATQTVAQWLFYFAVAIVVYLLATSVPKLFGSRPGTRVSLEDWTAPTDKREEKGRELTSDLASAIRRIEAPMAEGDSPLLNWDSAQLVFGTGSLGEIASLSTYVQETDVAVGPIKFNATTPARRRYAR